MCAYWLNLLVKIGKMPVILVSYQAYVVYELGVDVTAGYSFPRKHIIEHAICFNRLVLTINHVRFYGKKRRKCDV